MDKARELSPIQADKLFLPLSSLYTLLSTKYLMLKFAVFVKGGINKN